MRTFLHPADEKINENKKTILKNRKKKNNNNSLSFIIAVALISVAATFVHSAAAEKSGYLLGNQANTSPSLAQILRDYVIIHTPEGYMLQRKSEAGLGKRLSKGDFQLRVRKAPSSVSGGRNNFQLRVRKPFPTATGNNNFQLRVRKAGAERSSSLSNFQLRVRKSGASSVGRGNFQLRVRKMAGPTAQRNFQLRVRKRGGPSSNFQLRVRKNWNNDFYDDDDITSSEENPAFEEEMEENAYLRDLLDRYQLLHTPSGVILRDIAAEKRDAEEASEAEDRDE